MILTHYDGVPVLVKGNEPAPRIYRFHLKKKKDYKNRIENKPFSRLSPRHQKALKLYAASGCDDSKKTEIGKAAGFSPMCARRVMNKLVKRNKIQKLLDKKAPDTKIANELCRLAFESIHPLSKEDKPDNTNRNNALKEINKIKRNYPPKEVNIRALTAHMELTPDDHDAYQKYRSLRMEEHEEEV
jgi:hypothetical protein